MAMIERVALRCILDSRGARTVEAEVTLDGGAFGRASAPVAIAPGARERGQSTFARVGPLDTDSALAVLTGVEGQDAVDHLLDATGLGADVRTAVSVAYCRARIADRGGTMVGELAARAGTVPTLPRLVVNVFSGGIHGGGLPFQNVMIVPGLGSVAANVEAALAVYGEVERRLSDAGPVTYSHSSGMVIRDRGPEDLLSQLADAIERHVPHPGTATIGIDVAGEHLRRSDGRYRLGSELLDGAVLLDRHRALLDAFPIAFFEDPFDPADEALWRQLRRDRPKETQIFGDDLFVTDPARLTGDLADGLVVKVNQIGSLRGALAAARRALDLDMALCVSHRSGETDDTLVCDLAVALGASFLKLGGPRRGDRIAKYNELLRLAESWEYQGDRT